MQLMCDIGFPCKSRKGEDKLDTDHNGGVGGGTDCI